MKHFKIVLIAACLATFIFSIPPAYSAEPLTSADVERFIGSYRDTSNIMFESKILGPGKNYKEVLTTKNSRELLALMKQKVPAYYTKLDAAVKKHGYSSAENWGDKSDRILKAHLNDTVKDIDLDVLKESMQGVSPEVMASLPPEVQMLMDPDVIENLKTLKTPPPEADIKVVEPYREEIDHLIREQQ